jgi:hypothetical protein
MYFEESLLSLLLECMNVQLCSNKSICMTDAETGVAKHNFYEI